MKNLKKVLALVLAVVMIMGTVAVASAKTYTDVKSSDNYADAIDILSTLGILDGFEDGTFKSEGNLNREQAAKLVAIVHNAATNNKIQTNIADLYSNAQNPFVDCNDSWALPYINYCRITGLADGMTATTYAPKRQLTGVQWLKLMLTTLGFDTGKEGYTGTGWDVNVLNRANEVGLTAGLAKGWKGIAPITRGEAAQILVNAMQAYLVEYGQLVKEYPGTATVKPIAKAFISNEQVNKTGTRLAEKMGLTITRMYDVFGRPGYKWAYARLAWSKFYMDAPLASYTTAVSDCDILVAAGIDKNSKDVMGYDEFVNGVLTTGRTMTHVNKACYGAAHGSTGALTQLFWDGTKYIITRIDTYLAKVKNVTTNAAHGNNGGVSTFTIYPASTKFDNATDTYTVSGLYSYAKNSYVLAYVTLDVAKAGTAYAGKVYAADTIVATSATETASSGVYTIAEYANTGFVDVKQAESKVQTLSGRAFPSATAGKLTVDGTQTPVAVKYGLDEINVETLSFVNTTYTANFFRDQYDNLIGDTEATTQYSYGVVTGMVWITSGASYSDSQFASAGFVNAGANEVADIKVLMAGNTAANLGYLKGTESSTYGTLAAHEVATVKGQNYDYSNASNTNNYGVVKYVESDGVYTLIYNDPTVTTLTTKTVNAATPMLEANFVADENTVFTVRTRVAGKDVYTSYTGIKNVPTIKNAAAIVAVKENPNAFVSFVYVDAVGAIFAGSSTVAFVYAEDVSYEEYGVYYTYNGLFINGEKTSINVPTTLVNGATVTPTALFANTGLYVLEYNADASQVINVTPLNPATDKLVQGTIKSVSGSVVRAAVDADSFTAENAKIYFVYQMKANGTPIGYVNVEAKSVEDLAGAVNARFEYTYSTSKTSADVIYVYVELD